MKFDFVERCLTPKVVIVGILLLLTSWIYPPWIHYSSYSKTSHVGWYFIFDTYQGGADVRGIDFGRLFLLNVIILATVGLIAFGMSQASFRKWAIRITFYTLILSFVAGMVFGGWVLFHRAKPASGLENAPLDPLAATPPQTSQAVLDPSPGREVEQPFPAPFDPDAYLNSKQTEFMSQSPPRLTQW